MVRPELFKGVIVFTWALALILVAALFVADLAGFTQEKASQSALLVEKAERLAQIKADADALGAEIAGRSGDARALDKFDSKVNDIQIRVQSVKTDPRYQFPAAYFPLTEGKVDEMAANLDRLRSVLDDLVLQKRNLLKIDEEIGRMMDRLDQINQFAKMRARMQDLFGYLDALRSSSIQDDLINAYRERHDGIVQQMNRDASEIKTVDEIFDGASLDMRGLLAREGKLTYWTYLKDKFRRFSLAKAVERLVK